MLPELVCCIAAAVAVPGILSAQAPLRDSLPYEAYLEDFDAAWVFIHENYAYFDRSRTDWPHVRTLFRPGVAQVRNQRGFVALLEDMVEELYDAHAQLGVNTATSPRLVPSGTDLWAEHRGERAFLTDVRAGSEAERAGLRAGMEILAIGGRSVADVVRERLPEALREADPAAHDWALRAALAGRHDAPVRVEVLRGSRRQRISFRPAPPNRPPGPLSASILEGDIGYVRVHDALGDLGLIAAWDSALATLRGTRGLVLDLRDTPSGGNTTVARAIMSRLTAEERPYQRHELAAEERLHGVRRIWVELVAPRGSFTYGQPVAVLVGRWTGSMGEGLAIGLDAMPHTTLIGTPMAGLRGATYGTRLPNTGIEVRIPAERLYHIDGTPREEFVPSVLVLPAEPAADAALETALGLLRAGG